MSCFSELTYSMYADGELSPPELHEVEAHLDRCTRCRSFVEALHTEARLLTNVLRGAEWERVRAAARLTRLRDVLWTAAGVLAAALGLRAILDLFTRVQPPDAVDWLNPFSLAAQLDAFFSAVFYMIEEGATMLISSITTLSVLVLGLLALAGLLLALRRRPVRVSVLVTLLLLLIGAAPGQAIEVRKASRVDVPSGETVDDTLIIKAATASIDGVVTGDLIAFTRNLAVKGTVKGDLIAFSMNLDVDGTVEGNVFAFAQWMNATGKFSRNVYAFGQNAKFSSASHIGADATLFGSQISTDGTVGRDLHVLGDYAEVRGTVGRDLVSRCARLTLLGSAQVGGDLTAYVKEEKKLHIDPGATIAGETHTRLRQLEPSRFTQPKFYLWQAVRLAAAFLTGLLLFWLFPALAAARLRTAGETLRSVGVGFLALVATPVAAIIAAITLIGIPVAVVAVLTLVVGIYLSFILAGVVLGWGLLRRPAVEPGHVALPLLVGLVVLRIAGNLPYVGGWIDFLVILLGLGIMLRQIHRFWRRPQSA